jgi:hypothetical protein
MKWVTRERPKIDRIACPWLIARFIDKEPEFLYVPSADVLGVAERTGAVPYDIPGVEMSHVGDRCSFDAFLAKFGLNDLALEQLAAIVRGAARTRRVAWCGAGRMATTTTWRAPMRWRTTSRCTTPSAAAARP